VRLAPKSGSAALSERMALAVKRARTEERCHG
jgi:hypothetical protein